MTGITAVAGDLLIAVGCGEGSGDGVAITLGTANGFVEGPDSPQGANDGDGNEEDPEVNCAWFYKVAVGGDAAPVFADSGNNTTCAVHQFRGVRQTGNPWDVTAGGNDSGASDTSAVLPGDTTTVNDVLVVMIHGTSNNATSTANCGAVTNADLTGILERFDSSNTQQLGSGHCVMTGEKHVAGAYAAGTFTAGSTTYKAAWTIALAPPLNTGVRIQPGFPKTAGQATGTGMTLNTGSHSSSGAGLVVAVVAVENPFGAITDTAITDDAAEIGAWTRRESVKWTGTSFDDFGWAEVWTAEASGAYTSATITLTVTSPEGHMGGAMAVYVLDNYDDSGGDAFLGDSASLAASGDADSQVVAGTVTTTRAGSMVFGAGLRGDGNTAFTAQAGTRIDRDQADPTAGSRYSPWHKTDETSAGDYTVGATNDVIYYAYATLEVLPPGAPGGSAVCGPNLLLGMGCR